MPFIRHNDKFLLDGKTSREYNWHYMINLQIHSSQELGLFKPLHGVNNGPVGYGSLVNVSRYYQDIKVPHVRLHDTNWPHPREVDIHTIFPDFEADENDARSYDFSRTDEYIRTVVETGAQIIYRLGESIEHTAQKYYIHPPRDFAKWARVCIHIIRHLNEGWADGHHFGIRHWEIWNEPDNPDPKGNPMWTGTPQQYFELYDIVSRAIKAYDATLQVGGYAATMVNPEFAAQFFDFCRAKKPPLDFFSFHSYAPSLQTIETNAREIRAQVTHAGYPDAQMHFNEWNFVPPMPPGFQCFALGHEREVATFFETAKGEMGAAFDAAALILMQDLPIDIANFYDGQPLSYFSLFNAYGVPQKNYYAFRAFAGLLETPHRVCIEGANNPNLRAAAGISSNGKLGVLLANFQDASTPVALNFPDLPRENYQVTQTWTDKERTFAAAPASTLSAQKPTLQLFMPPYSVALVSLD